MLFQEACAEYMAEKARKVRANTLEGYESGLRCHVLPAWGLRELAGISHAELQAWVDSVPTAGAAAKAFKCFRQVYRWALRRLQLRVWDVTQGIELPRAAPRRREQLSAADVRRVLRAVEGEPYEAVVVACASLGLRPSEAAGLDWSDVDWRSGWVHVRRGAHSVGRGTVEYPCKTELSDRWLRLPRFALARLRELRGSRRRGRMRGELSPRQIYGRLKRLLRRVGLGRASVQLLRHAWATVAISAGAALEDVAVALGHSSVEMCRRHYLLSTRAVVERSQWFFTRAVLKGA